MSIENVNKMINELDLTEQLQSRYSFQLRGKNLPKLTTGGRIMVPQRCLYPDPQNLWICYITCQGEIRLQMELRLLIIWPGDKEIKLDYLDGPNVITRFLRCERVAEEPGSEEYRKSLEVGKGKETVWSIASRRTQLWENFAFSPVRPIMSDFWLQNYKVIN